MCFDFSNSLYCEVTRGCSSNAALKTRSRESIYGHMMKQVTLCTIEIEVVLTAFFLNLSAIALHHRQLSQRSHQVHPLACKLLLLQHQIELHSAHLAESWGKITLIVHMTKKWLFLQH